jgi:hypothetical protein
MLNGTGVTALEKPWLQPKDKLGAAVRTSAAPAANGFNGVRKHPDTVRFDAQLEDDNALCHRRRATRHDFVRLREIRHAS